MSVAPPMVRLDKSDPAKLPEVLTTGPLMVKVLLPMERLPVLRVRVRVPLTVELPKNQ